MSNFKNLLKKTFLNDLYILWTAPIDDPVIKPVKEGFIQAKNDKGLGFEKYTFKNIILAKKSF